MKSFTCPLLFVCCLFFTSCNTATPEKYFDVAVLNTNMLMGFAGDGLSRELESPSVKLDQPTGKTVPMSRKEVLDTKARFLDEDFKDLKGLKETPDTKDMLQSSLALYEFVLPVYKKEYAQLASLYDQGAAKEKIEALTKEIHDKYFSRFSDLETKLITIGKVYAERHSIKVDWGVGGSVSN